MQDNRKERDVQQQQQQQLSMSPQKEKEVEIERHRSDVDTWERDRAELEREKESREKRQSKDITPLDHRGSSGIINIVEHQTNSQDRRSSARREIRNSSKDTSHNGNNGNVSSGNSSITNISTSPQKSASGHRLANGSGMNSIIFPLLTDVSDFHIDFHISPFFPLRRSMKMNDFYLILFTDPEKVSICRQEYVGIRFG